MFPVLLCVVLFVCTDVRHCCCCFVCSLCCCFLVFVYRLCCRVVCFVVDCVYVVVFFSVIVFSCVIAFRSYVMFPGLFLYTHICVCCGFSGVEMVSVLLFFVLCVLFVFVKGVVVFCLLLSV